MYKILRIVFCVLAALCAAAAILVFILVEDWRWGVMVVAAAVVSGTLMVTFKQLQESDELKKNPPPPKGDFITGKTDNKDKDE